MCRQTWYACCAWTKRKDRETEGLGERQLITLIPGPLHIFASLLFSHVLFSPSLLVTSFLSSRSLFRYFVFFFFFLSLSPSSFCVPPPSLVSGLYGGHATPSMKSIAHR